MKLSKENIEILKSLSQINEQVYITPDTLGISTNDHTLLAYYDYGVKFTIPDDKDGNPQNGFGIYNLNELLSILSLYDNPTIKEEQNSLKIFELSNVNKYQYTSKECITVPLTKDLLFNGDKENDVAPKIEPATSEFTISEDDFTKLMKQSQILKSPHISFKGTNIVATDMDDSSANSYTTKVDAKNLEDENADPEMDSFLLAETFQKLVPAEYVVKVNDKTVVFENSVKQLTYIIVCLTD